jgi:hypothetical protein
MKMMMGWDGREKRENLSPPGGQEYGIQGGVHAPEPKPIKGDRSARSPVTDYYVGGEMGTRGIPSPQLNQKLVISEPLPLKGGGWDCQFSLWLDSLSTPQQPSSKQSFNTTRQQITFPMLQTINRNF